MLISSSHPVDVPRQLNNEQEPMVTLSDPRPEFLNLKEVAMILRLAPVSIYRLIAKQALPVYRASRKVLFKKTDVIAYLERSCTDAPLYGGPKAQE